MLTCSLGKFRNRAVGNCWEQNSEETRRGGKNSKDTFLYIITLHQVLLIFSKSLLTKESSDSSFNFFPEIDF